MTVAELQAELGSPDLVIIDVRQDADWRKSDQKIAGAVREDPSAPQNWAGNYAKEKKIVLFCT
jgi:rhodanese-related sulfurtransferase